MALSDQDVQRVLATINTHECNLPLPSPAAFEFWWKMLQFVYELPDPASVPPLPILAATKLERTGPSRLLRDARQCATVAPRSVSNSQRFRAVAERSKPRKLGEDGHTYYCSAGFESR